MTASPLGRRQENQSSIEDLLRIKLRVQFEVQENEESTSGATKIRHCAAGISMSPPFPFDESRDGERK